ncbi:MAG TPA: hypothetical protein VGN72_13010 [Tepidisphaeraceae bacterium]|jgi:transglutaminase-like putative cysteine protease|nr:hypothetical protein [Tepidisphaeraceae bacterium]
MQLSNDFCSRLARFTFTVLMTAAWTGFATTARAQPAPAAGDDADSTAEVKRAVAFLEQMTKVAKVELRQPNASPSDVTARAAALGNDVDKMFSYVRDQVRYEPYRGVLRGSRGALAARAANSFDKSLLLVEMLAAGGHGARLVRGTLPADAARTLVDQYLATDPLAGLLGELVPTNAPATEGVPADFAARVGLEKAYLDGLIADQQAASLDIITQAERATQSELKYLQDQIAAAGIKLGRPHDKWVAELTDRATDHVWVEVSDGQGGWRALDPSFPGATDAARGQNGAAMDAMPAELQHAVQFQIVYRHGEPGSEQETIVGEMPIIAADALWASPALVIVPGEEIPSATELLEMDPEAAVKQLMSIKRFQAVISLGARNFSSRVFDLKGNVFEMTTDGRVKGAAEIGQATGGMFGGLMGGGDDAAAEPESTFVDLAVRMTFTSPGAEPRVQSRVLLTKADTTGEHRLSPMLSWQMLLQSHLLDPAVAAHDALSESVKMIDAVLPMLQDGETTNEELNKLSTTRGSTFPTFLAGFAQVRQAGLARLVRENPQVAPLWDRPQLVIAERRFCGRKDGAHACARFGMDIVDNGLSFVPRNADATATAPMAALRQGVFDTAAEAVLPETSIQSGMGRSALVDTQRLRLAGSTMVAFDPRQAAPQSVSATLAESDRNWISKHEPTGHRVLAFTAPAAGNDIDAADLSWWSLDPETGTILGRRDGGRGSAMVEYGMQIFIVGVCLIFVMVLQQWEIEKQGGGKLQGKARNANAIQMLGCFLGLGTGALGVNLAGRAALSASQKFVVGQALGVINAAIGGGINLWGYKAAE